MKLAVCDDNSQDLRQMVELSAQYDPSMEIFSFSSAQALYESGQHFDAVLLDIEMDGPNGYEIAVRMAQEESHPVIIFATNSAAYAVRGYGLALRYLLKPLSLKLLSEALDAVKQELRSNRLTVMLDGISHVLKVQYIRYAEVQRHQIMLYTADGCLSFRGTLKDIVSQLPARWFAAPHQSYVVNLLHVRNASKTELTLTDGTRIPISRRRQQEFLRCFHRFLGVQP